MSKHTPGPWLVIPDHRPSGDVLIEPEDSDPDFAKRVVAIAPAQRHGEQEANARLIAAAPELLAELEKAVKILVELEEEGFIDLSPDYPTIEPHQLDSARAAIAKAKGESE